MKKQWSWIYLLLLCLIIGSAFYFRAFLYFYVISPFAQFSWAIYRIFASLDQEVYWFLLIGLIIFFGYRSIYSIPAGTQDKYAAALNSQKNREHFWLKAISTAIENGEGSREFLRRQFGQLFLSASNLSMRAKDDDTKTLLLSVQPPLPTELLSLFQESDRESKKRFRGVDSAFDKYVLQNMWWKKRQARAANYKEVNEILQSMEIYLEIDHENEPNG